MVDWNTTLLTKPGIRHLIQVLDLEPSLPQTAFSEECKTLMRRFLDQTKKEIAPRRILAEHEFYRLLAQIKTGMEETLYREAMKNDLPLQTLILSNEKEVEHSDFMRFLLGKDVAFTEGNEPPILDIAAYLERRESLQKEFKKMIPGPSSNLQCQNLDLYCKNIHLVAIAEYAKESYHLEAFPEKEHPGR